MEETEMSKKILGQKTEKTSEEKAKKDYLADDVLWTVTKDGCGKTVFNGSFAAALMTVDEKKKARNGVAKISNKTFTFERK